MHLITASIYLEQQPYISLVIDAPSKLYALSEQMDIIIIIYIEIASYTLKHMILWEYDTYWFNLTVRS